MDFSVRGDALGSRPPLLLPLSTAMLVSVWFGLVTGLVDAAYVVGARRVGGKFLFLSRDAVWLAPLANVVLFVIAGTCLGLAARVVPATVGRWLVPVGLWFLAWGGVLTLFKLHGIPLALLGLGLAVQTVRVLAPRQLSFVRLVRRSVGWLALGVGLIAAAVMGTRRYRETAALARLGPPSADRPNVLLLILDTVRSPNLSVYGYGRPTTPNLERLAARGVVFEHAIAPAPWTLPSHASMFTGRIPHELTATWLRPLDRRYPTLAERFEDRGYLTAGFVGNSYYAGSEGGIDRGFVHFEEYRISIGEAVNSSSLGQWIFSGRINTTNGLRRAFHSNEIFGRKTAEEIRRAFDRWVAARSANRPFFAFVNLFDAHVPYHPPEPFRSRFARPRPDGTDDPVASYDGAIAYLDDEIGRLLADLERLGLADNTIVVVASDHGEQHGEHGLYKHGNSLYRQLLEVPLMIAGPGIPRGTRVSEPVSLTNLAATILDLAGPPKTDGLPGQSLAQFWARGSTVGAQTAISEVDQGIRTPARYPVSRGNMASVVDGGLHYIQNADGQVEIYDFAHDPEELHDITSSVDPARQSQLKALLRPADSAPARRPDTTALVEPAR